LRTLVVIALFPGVWCWAPTRAGANLGGGYGGSGAGSIWASSWWQGSPEGPGPYTYPPSTGVDICSWHDVGPEVAGLGLALAESDLPPSFWRVPRSGGHPGIWGVLQWATDLARTEKSSDHFDLVACPQASEVPANGGNVASDLPRAHPPGSRPLYIWVFFDTVLDPPPGDLPGVVATAYALTELPHPRISTSPSRIGSVRQATVVNLPTWLWIDKSLWHTYRARAEAGGLVATVWAYPTFVTWSAGWDFPDPSSDPQGGTSLAPERLDQSCEGPGTPYRPGASPETQGACTAVFAEPTFGTRRSLTATVHWVVHWAVSNLAGVVGGEGLYPPTTTGGHLRLRVEQIESVITAG
jgi:hypothetical protein